MNTHVTSYPTVTSPLSYYSYSLFCFFFNLYIMVNVLCSPGFLSCLKAMASRARAHAPSSY